MLRRLTESDRDGREEWYGMVQKESGEKRIYWQRLRGVNADSRKWRKL